MNHLPLAVSVADAAKMAGIGRTSLYSAISSGSIKTKRFGRRTLIEVQSIRDFLANLPEANLAA